MKKTDWYSGDVKPVRKGLYERKYSVAQAMLDYWDGQRWRYGQRDMAALNQHRAWRGLTAPSK
jgi:hypothetical protein